MSLDTTKAVKFVSRFKSFSFVWRLGDIINQQPESSDTSLGQIALPPIQGEVRYDSINFRFGDEALLTLVMLGCCRDN